MADSIVQQLRMGSMVGSKGILDDFRELCRYFNKNNNAFKDIIDEIDKNNQIPPNFDANSLINFMDTIIQGGNKLYTHTQDINSMISTAMVNSKTYNSLANALRNRISSGLNTLIRQEDPSETSFLVGRNDYYTSNQVFTNRHSNFYNLICGSRRPERCRQRFLGTMNDLISRITDIIYFLLIWNFFSYSCDYLINIDAEIKIQERDVLEFPNYTLIIPIDLLRGIHAAHISKNFRNLIRQSSSKNSSSSSLSSSQRIFDNDSFLSANYVPERVVEMLVSRLQIPNIVIVDSDKNEIIYQFMYMKKASKMKINTIQQYVEHQKNILPGF